MNSSTHHSTKIGLFTATSIAVANMIGTGVFTSLGFQVAQIHSGFQLLLLWVVGGIFALCGALCYAELAAALPRSGGEYHFLTRIYHPAVGFVAGWTSITIGFAAPVALASMAFGKYFTGVFPGASPLAVSVLLVLLVTVAHLKDLRVGSFFQNGITTLKMIIIAVFIVAGLSFGNSQPLNYLPVTADWAGVVSAPFATSLIFVMYAYSGWNSATYITGEVRDPWRNLPRSLVIATSLVMVVYVALNAVFLRTTPLDELAGKVDVAFVAAEHIFGTRGGRFVASAICVSLISCISAMTWTGPRISQTMGEDFALLRFLSVRTKTAIPRAAVLFQTAIVLVLLLTSTFEMVLVYVQFALNLCSFLTVSGLIWLRWKAPELPRPYKTFGYPFTPLIFLAISLATMIYLLKTNPVESLAGLATLLAGLAVYFVSSRQPESARTP